jgi:hypothetical protein
MRMNLDLLLLPGVNTPFSRGNLLDLTTRVVKMVSLGTGGLLVGDRPFFLYRVGPRGRGSRPGRFPRPKFGKLRPPI